MPSRRESLPAAPTRKPDLDDDFSTGLSSERWMASYLPQWTTSERARAHYKVVADGIELRIDSDQPDWRPEDAPLRVSNLQTGVYSGPVGSGLGTHRHRVDLDVRTETPQRLLFAPSRGRVEITVSASRDTNCMVAAWLVGTEHRSPTESGEICIFEIDADAIGETTLARTGIKAHHDPHLTTDMSEVEIPVDASSPHTWTVVWGEGETVIGCEGRTLRRITQAPDYPLFLLIDLFEIGPREGSYPKTATIHHVRAWHHERMTLRITDDPAADELLDSDPLALLIGMLLDQQVAMETAFAGPLKIKERTGTIAAAEIADYDPDAFKDAFSQSPAVHRYPGSMAERVQKLAAAIRDEWGGDASALWTDGDPDGKTVLKRLKALPGFGEQKAKIFLALLGKQRGFDGDGWREASAPYGEKDAFRSVADIVSPESLATVRENKKAAKAAAKSAKG